MPIEENFEAAVEDEGPVAAGRSHSHYEENSGIKDTLSKDKGGSSGKYNKTRSNSTNGASHNTNPVDEATRKDRQSQSLSNTDTDPPVIPIVVTQPVHPPPWPEWSDDFINEESWDVDSGVDYFEDTFAATDYLNMKAYHWMRPSEFLREPPTVVKFSSPVIDLITPNSDLCEKSEVLRYILSEISELYDYSIQNKFVECEGEGVVYVPNYAEDDRRWTPWSHIYSCCKAGVRGEKPVYNAKGKYYVRLYFLGAWRRILVDDRIPVLASGQTALPLTALNELWPMLLTKALLKVATVSWKDDDVKKFSAISALTGWVFEWIDDIDGVNENELWADLQNTLPKYLDPKKIPSCYTLLHRSHKKLKFGDIDESDTFWWMPYFSAPPSIMEDAALQEEVADDELFEVDTNDIIGEPDKPYLEMTDADGEELVIHVEEIKWKRKSVLLSPTKHKHKSKSNTHRRSQYPSTNSLPQPGEKAEEDEDAEAETEDKTELTPNMDAMTVTKKKKKKGIGAALDEAKSEQKTTKKKKHNNNKKVKPGETSKGDLNKRSKKLSNLANEVNEVEGLDVPDDDLDDKISANLTPMNNRRKSVKVKAPPGAKHWAKLKNIVMDESTRLGLSGRLSKSLRTSFLEKHPSQNPLNIVTKASKHRRSKHGGTGGTTEEDEPAISGILDHVTQKRFILPSVAEILYGVQKYAGIDYRNIVKNWENICGKDSPISLMVVLKEFPRSEENSLESATAPFVPAFLQHPIQLTEVRDTILQKPSDRPETPLWKRFRWKKWAMKKGLIPMEEDHSNDVIRAVKAKTPFVFKNDWYDFATDNAAYAEEEEMDGEDDDDDYGGSMGGFFFSLTTAKRKSKESDSPKAPTPPIKVMSPPPSQQGQGNLLGPGLMPRMSRGGSMHVASQQDGLALQAAEPKPQLSRKSIVAAKSDMGDGPRKSVAQSMRNNVDNASSGGKVDIAGSNITVILHESELVRGESEEDFDENFKMKMLKRQAHITPTAACASLWFDCSDIANNLRKFCKFYTSQSIFGSCYILRREPSVPVTLDPLFSELHSELPKYPEFLTEYKQKQSCLNLSIEFDRCKNYHVTEYHLDDKEDINSAFYLFSDCWTEQELIITVHVVQEEYLKEYGKATGSPLPQEMPGPPPTPMSHSHHHHGRGIAFVTPVSPPRIMTLPLTLVIEPWDWRHDTSLAKPLLVCTWINDRWISHVNLPAGRNTFRIWLLYGGLEAVETRSRKRSPQSDDESSELIEFLRKKQLIPFSVRIVSQTPIYVGTKTEVLNYMTNPPMLFLKQCERLANNLWGLFACFGKQRSAYSRNLRQLRRSYCPAYSQPNTINKLVRGAHATFEELFVSLVTLFNDGKLDRMLILTLRVLFLDPMIGRGFATNYRRHDAKLFQGVFRGLGKKARFMLMNAAMTIQKYYRGWRVRRLFQLRRRSHPDFKRIQFSVRRIAYLLANETDSLYSQRDPTTGKFRGSASADGDISVVDLTVDPEKVPPSILPSPPHWSVDLLRYLMERHPWLITIHPHAHCIPHHVKIQELEGELPQRIKCFAWYPFFRETLIVPPDKKSCFIELELQVYFPHGIYMKIINNDNGKFLQTVSSRHFLGRLFENKYGYTVLCYRWTSPTIKLENSDRPASTLWKLRLVTPHDQDGPRFQTKSQYLSQIHSGQDIEANNDNALDEVEAESGLIEEGVGGGDAGEKRQSYLSTSSEITEEFPNKLCLRRLTGYYTPNKDYSVCQYILETEEKKATVSLRFLASNPKAHLRVSIWDCVKKAVVFDDTCEGGLIAPVINLHVTKPKPIVPVVEEEEETPTPPRSSSEGLHSPVSAELEGSASGLLEQVMSASNNLPSKTSSKSSFEGNEEEENEEVEALGDGQNSRKASMASDKSSSPPAGKKMTNKRRFIISVYVAEDTWLLSERELLYLLYRERKFFKSIKVHHCKELLTQTEEKIKKAEEEARKAAEEAQKAAEEAAALAAQLALEAQNEQALGAGIEFRLTSAGDQPVLGTSPSAATIAVQEKEKPKKDYKELQSVKRKGKKKEKDADKNAAEKKEKEGEKKDVENVGPPSASNPVVEPTPAVTPTYPTTPPPTTVSGENVNEEETSKVTLKDKKKSEKVKRRMSGNLHVKYGGHQCQNIKHLDQPHWIMEIVTDSKVKYKLKSNWQILRKRLLQAHESWESGGVELLYHDLSTRLDFLLENFIEENYHHVKHHNLSMVDPIVNLYSSLHMDDYDMTAFTNQEFIHLLVQAWSPDPEESKKAGEKLLQNRIKKILDSGMKKDYDQLLPEQLLDYIPKNLRNLAEAFLRRIEERELERERVRERQLNLELQMKTVNLLEEEEEEEEEEEHEEVENASVAGGATTMSESIHPPPSSGLKVEGSVMPGHSRLGLPGGPHSPTRKTTSDMRSVARKGKKAPAVKSQDAVTTNSPSKATVKKPKAERDRSASLQKKTNVRESLALGSKTALRMEIEKRKSTIAGGAATDVVKELEGIDENYETELEKIRSCSHVEVILEKYNEFFHEPKSIRQKLVEMIEGDRHGHVMDGPKKLLLTKTGISKYGEKISDGDGGTKPSTSEKEGEEIENKESAVANRLLKWGFDFSLLPPIDEHDDVIEDPGELPMFLMRTIIDEQLEREHLEAEMAAAALALQALEEEQEE